MSEGLIHASQVIPLELRRRPGESGMVIRSLVPLKLLAFPYFPEPLTVVPVAVPLWTLGL